MEFMEQKITVSRDPHDGEHVVNVTDEETGLEGFRARVNGGHVMWGEIRHFRNPLGYWEEQEGLQVHTAEFRSPSQALHHARSVALQYVNSTMAQWMARYDD